MNRVPTHYHITWQHPRIVPHYHPSRRAHVHEGLCRYTTSRTVAERQLADVVRERAAYFARLLARAHKGGAR